MTVLEITIQRGSGDVRPVVLEHSRPDSLSPIRKEGELRLGDDTRQRLLQLEIDPRPYGELLGEAPSASTAIPPSCLPWPPR